MPLLNQDCISPLRSWRRTTNSPFDYQSRSDLSYAVIRPQFFYKITLSNHRHAPQQIPAEISQSAADRNQVPPIHIFDGLVNGFSEDSTESCCWIVISTCPRQKSLKLCYQEGSMAKTPAPKHMKVFCHPLLHLVRSMGWSTILSKDILFSGRHLICPGFHLGMDHNHMDLFCNTFTPFAKKWGCMITSS